MLDIVNLLFCIVNTLSTVGLAVSARKIDIKSLKFNHFI